jgi:hypothetical protein
VGAMGITRGMSAKLGRLALAVAAVLTSAVFGASYVGAAEKEKPVARDYRLVRAAPAPRTQTWADAQTKTGVSRESGCMSCHYESDAHTMHRSPAVVLGCTDCHGGNPRIGGPELHRLAHDDPRYVAARDQAHVLPRYPNSWGWPSSANRARSYTLLNVEAPEFVRFVNPSDYRAVRESCGSCHIEIIEAAERSLMATGAMLWGGAAYNNGILPFKNYLNGESYTRDGQNAAVFSPSASPQERARGVLEGLYPLPTWHVIPPGDIFRVFERGGRNINSQFAEIGLPNPTGIIQRLEEPGRPDIRQSNRGAGTGLRVAIPVLNIHKTRLNDPFMWFMGTNDQPGDYRHSGCAGCHVIYANDRQPTHSSTYAVAGRDGQSFTRDPTIRAGGRGFVRNADPTASPTGAETEGQGHAAGAGPPSAEDGAHGAGSEPAAAGSDAGEPARAAPADGNHRQMGERGHPIEHVFTRAIPTSQCMVCHMHQPNIFLNTYLGYTMWDYESDADLMWPGPENRLPAHSPEEEQRFRNQAYPTAAEVVEVLDRNPEGAAPRGLWADVEFLREVYDRVNPLARLTQFADYHGHGWNFRGIFRRDREGNLVNVRGERLDPNAPDLYRRPGEDAFAPAGVNPGEAVHMMDIHAEVGLQCADCHFAQDSHGNGFVYGEVANAIEISCRDCHGTARDYANLRTSNVAAPPRGTDLTALRNEDGRRRFEWMNCQDALASETHILGRLQCPDNRRVLIQRAITDPNISWVVSQVRDGVDRSLYPNAVCAEETPNRDRETGPCFNLPSARAKLMDERAADTNQYNFGEGVPDQFLAHADNEMTCFTCHLSWTTSCAGCHLPIEANFLTRIHHFEGPNDTNIETRNFATYNPQVARDEMFQLGRHQTTKPGEPDPVTGATRGIIAPIRSTSALILSSTNLNRERIYVQQPPIAASGYSSQAFAPHFPHTVRRTETKTCSDCHVSRENNNNAIMAQTLLHGTNFVNFVGLHAWSGLQGGFQATRVTEWDEPQAVIGSYLHRFAYPDYFRLHIERNNRELLTWERGTRIDAQGSGETQAMEEFTNIHQGTGGEVRCLQLRGEYMFLAEGAAGFQVYDVANIGNKGTSERIVTAPFSPLGQNTRVPSRNATCMALATNQPIDPNRNRRMAETVRTEPDPDNPGQMRTVSLLEENQEQPMHAIYNYAVVTDAVEGLILVDVRTMADGEPRNNFLERATFDATVGGGTAWNPDGVLTGASHITLGGTYAYITTPTALVVVDLSNPLAPQLRGRADLNGGRATALQFRYLWAVDADGLKLFDVTDLANPRPVASGAVPLADAHRVYLARTYAYVAAGPQGLAIIDITRPERPGAPVFYTGDHGQVLNDTRDVIVASTNASLFAYVADGRNGVRIIQLTSPESQPAIYGFSPQPRPQLIAWARTPSPALSLSKGLDRDRGVDETGHQMAVFGRLGSRPFNRYEQQQLFLSQGRPDSTGALYQVRDTHLIPREEAMRDWVEARR